MFLTRWSFRSHSGGVKRPPLLLEVFDNICSFISLGSFITHTFVVKIRIGLSLMLQPHWPLLEGPAGWRRSIEPVKEAPLDDISEPEDLINSRSVHFAIDTYPLVNKHAWVTLDGESEIDRFICMVCLSLHLCLHLY